jgi:hypothetical protein
MSSKYCKYCDTEKKESDFTKGRNKCKSCRYAYIKEWKKHNIDIWKVNNNDKIKNYMRTYMRNYMRKRRLKEKNTTFKNKTSI